MSWENSQTNDLRVDAIIDVKRFVNTETPLSKGNTSLYEAAIRLALNLTNHNLSHNVTLGSAPLGIALIWFLMSFALSIAIVPTVTFAVFGASKAESADPPSWLKDAIVPIFAAIIAGLVGFWPHIQARYRKRVFEALILRELEEIAPKKGCHDVWYDCLGKGEFIHQRIFENPTDSKDLILSLDPSLVYFVSQLWVAFKRTDTEQWLGI